MTNASRPSNPFFNPIGQRLLIYTMNNLIIYLLGYLPSNIRKDEKSGPMTIRTFPEPIWDCAPTGDYYSLTCRISRAPCFLHRWAQRIILGVRYRRK
jgi:hypothetical protein